MSRQQLYQEQYGAAYGFLRQNLFLAGKKAQVGAWFGETRKSVRARARKMARSVIKQAREQPGSVV